MPDKKPRYYMQLTTMPPVLQTLKLAASGKPQSILALSDGNRPTERSTATLIARLFNPPSCISTEKPSPRAAKTLGLACTSPASSAAIASEQNTYTVNSQQTLAESKPDSPESNSLTSEAPPLTIIQSDIMANWQGSIHLPQNKGEARVEYTWDDNTTRSDIYQYSHDKHGFNLIIGISILCLCSTDLRKTPEHQHTLCGGMTCTPQSVVRFFLIKILANLKDEHSVAILSGACFHTEQRRTEMYRKKLKQNIFKMLFNKIVGPLSLPSADSIRRVEARNHRERSVILAKQAVEQYHHGLTITRSAIDIFNRHPHNQGYQATIQMLELDGNPNIGHPGYAVIIQHP